MYSLMRRKAVYSTKTTTLSVVGPTAPAGPVYEEVSPKEEIELNTITKRMDQLDCETSVNVYELHTHDYFG